jgi:Xaa-Pro aminopeptidase
VPDEHQHIFEVVKRGRDVALDALRAAAQDGRAPQGWEIDRAVRDSITRDGYAEFFTHRTGHNLGPEELHGSAGVCLDDFETHDTRQLLPGVAFSVEPGVYLPGRFGVRLELNAVMTEHGPEVHTPVQNEVIRLA